MIEASLLRRAVAFLSAIAAAALLAFATSPAASADTTRTLNIALSCDSGGAIGYGLSVNNGSGWYYPNGSSYLVGNIKYFTVFIPASATTLAINTSCDDGLVNPYGNGPFWEGYYYTITSGTSTISANGNCIDEYVYPGPLVTYCSLSSLTYS